MTLPTERPTDRPAARPAERRGEIRIPNQVLSRMAARAAEEVDGVLEVRRGRTPWGGPTRATVDGDMATLSLNVSLAYPAPIRTVTDRLRRHLATRIHEMTGLTVDHVDIEVGSLVPGGRAAEPEVSER